jgi:hypothetical protein
VHSHLDLGAQGVQEGLPLHRQLLVLELGPDLLPDCCFVFACV